MQNENDNTKTAPTKKPRASKAKTEPAAPFEEVKAEAVTTAETGQIDLHLKSPEDVETIIKKEVAKFNDGFNVALLEEDQNIKLTPAEKLEILKTKILGDLVDPNDPSKGRTGGYVVNNEDDAEGYKKMDAARKLLVKLRTGVKDKHELLKGNYLKVGRALDLKKNELTDLILEIETPLKTRLKEIDDIKAEKLAAEEKAKKEKTDARVAEIKEAGMTFDGSFYVIVPSISLDVVTLGALNDEQYAKFLKRVKEVKADLDWKAFKEDQRKRVEKYLFERKGRKQRAEAQRLQDQANEIKKERRDGRAELLEMMGFAVNQSGTLYTLKKDAGQVSIAAADLEEETAAEWGTRFADLKKEVKDLEARQTQHEAKLLKDQRDQDRKTRVLQIGYRYDLLSRMFFTTTETYGDTNFYNESQVFESQDFETLLNEMKAAAKKTFDDHAAEVTKKQQAEDRKNERIRELVNGFGMSKQIGDVWIRQSKHEDEPELKPYKGALMVTVTQINEAGEAEWTKLIEGLTALNSQIQHAEKQAEQRIADEKENVRLLLLSAAERVAIYLDQLEKVKAPEDIMEPGLKLIVSSIGSDFKTARERLKIYQQK